MGLDNGECDLVVRIKLTLSGCCDDQTAALLADAAGPAVAEAVVCELAVVPVVAVVPALAVVPVDAVIPAVAVVPVDAVIPAVAVVAVDAVVCAVALVVLPYDFREALINTLIGTVMALSLVVLTGFVGQISVVQLSLAGVAGFTISHLAVNAGIGFPIALIQIGRAHV